MTNINNLEKHILSFLTNDLDGVRLTLNDNNVEYTDISDWNEGEWVTTSSRESAIKNNAVWSLYLVSKDDEKPVKMFNSHSLVSLFNLSFDEKLLSFFKSIEDKLKFLCQGEFGSLSLSVYNIHAKGITFSTDKDIWLGDKEIKTNDKVWSLSVCPNNPISSYGYDSKSIASILEKIGLAPYLEKHALEENILSKTLNTESTFKI